MLFKRFLQVSAALLLVGAALSSIGPAGLPDGMSLDAVKDQAKFHKEQELNFKLLSDPDGSAADKLGAIASGARWTNRVTFVIDPEGVLRYRDDEVNVNSHGMDLAEILVQLQEE